MAAQSYKIRIAARLRPKLDTEPEDDGIKVVRNEATGSSCISIVNQRSQIFTFPFSSCYDQDSSQEEIFVNDVQPLLDALYSGVTVTIFAYGVTSSGKTFTMSGSPSQPGIIPRVMKELLHRKSPHQPQQVSFSMSYMEIYKDEVYDLLGDRENAPKLPVREDDAGRVFVAKLSTVPISSEQEFQTVYSRASKSRSVGSTNLNSASSRSHAILTVMLTIVDEERQKTLTGKLVLVDLAGSENNKMTGNDSIRMAESAAINKSLSVLGQVVHSLNKGATRIPYRDSKLTRILQDALGGSSIGLLIINLAPTLKFRQDTLNTLNFAVRTKSVENKPVVNERDNRPAPKPHFAAVQTQAPKLAPAVLPVSVTVESSAPIKHAAPAPRPSIAPTNSFGSGSRHPRASMIPIPGGQYQPYQPLMAIREQPQKAGLLPLTEEMSDQIAAIVKMEVAKELERQEKERLSKEEEMKRARDEELKREQEEEDEVVKSMEIDGQESDNDPTGEPEQISVSKNMLEHLLQQNHQTLDTDLMTGLANLEQKFKREDNDGRLASVLSPISKKKAGRSYVHLARTMSDRGHMEISLELYRKAQLYVPDNAKLRDRIIEMEYAVKNRKPFVPSPKRAKKPASKPRKKSKGKQKDRASLRVDIYDNQDMDLDENDGDTMAVSLGDDSSTSSRTSGKRKRPFGQEVINSPKKRKGKKGAKTKIEGCEEEVGTARRSDGHQTLDVDAGDTDDEWADGDEDEDEWMPLAPPRKLRGKRKLIS